MKRAAMMKIQADGENGKPAIRVGTAPPPAHETVYRQLRESILFGELAPGQPVTIQGIADMLGAGMTPVREAIRRLTAEGALEFQGNRRVCVPQLTAGNVSELIFARQSIEPQLAMRATERATDPDLLRLDDDLSAFHARCAKEPSLRWAARRAASRAASVTSARSLAALPLSLPIAVTTSASASVTNWR